MPMLLRTRWAVASLLLSLWTQPVPAAEPTTIGFGAIKGAGTLDQEKLTSYIHTHEFHAIVGDLRFGDDGDWVKDQILFVPFHDVKSNDIEQFHDMNVETILHPLGMRSGLLQEP